MKQIKVMTWNVLYKEKADNILALVKKINPDILCCQELTQNSQYNNFNTADFLASQLGYQYYFEPADIISVDGEKFPLGNGVFARFPLSQPKKFLIHGGKNPSTGSPSEKRLYIEAKVNVNKKGLIIGTTHLSFTPWFEITPKKRGETEALVAEIKKNSQDFILAGDFNAKPDSYTIKQVEKYLKSAGPSSTEATFTTKPFSYMGMEANGLDYRIDYIFTTPDIKMLSSKIIKTEFSDHLPIVAEVQI